MVIFRCCSLRAAIARYRRDETAADLFKRRSASNAVHLPARAFNVEGSKPVHLLAARLLAAKAVPAVRLFDIALPVERTSN